MNVSILTLDSGRHRSIEMVRRWVEDQTVDVQHVVAETYIDGLDRCSGEWILLTDDGDWYGPAYAEQVLTTLRANHATVGGRAFREVYNLRARAFADQVVIGPLPGTLAFHRKHIPDAIRAVEDGKSIKYLAPIAAPCFAAPYLRIVGLYDSRAYTADRFPKSDPMLAYLRRRIGEEATELYLEVLAEVKA